MFGRAEGPRSLAGRLAQKDAQKINGRKRHVVVDTKELGRARARLGGYTDQLVDGAHNKLGISLRISMKRPDQAGLRVLRHHQ